MAGDPGAHRGRPRGWPSPVGRRRRGVGSTDPHDGAGWGDGPCADRRRGAPVGTAARWSEDRLQCCPACGSLYLSFGAPEHLASGCLFGLLIGVLLEREEISFGDRELLRLTDSRYGIEWLWEGFGAPAADALEDLLLECGGERIGEGDG
jgi:hypothetical protein